MTCLRCECELVLIDARHQLFQTHHHDEDCVKALGQKVKAMEGKIDYLMGTVHGR